ncbi:MAG: hypothetical protein HY811_08660 [Planctomycetes bacterium]|nr:hypothetical protein [Planctomycetota bacterium]
MKEQLPKLIKWIANLFTDNFGTKMMALLLAIGIWVYVNRLYTEPPKPVMAQLKLIVPSGMVGYAEDADDGKPVSSIEITLEGPRGILSEITDDITCRHRVAPTMDDNIPQVEDIKESDFNLPSGVMVKKMKPAKIRVWLMKEMEKYIIIDTDNCWSGKPSSGYRVSEVWAEPAEIMVRGPKSVLETKSSIGCIPVDVSGATASFEREGRIQPTIENKPVVASQNFKLVITIAEELKETVLKTDINIVLPQDFAYKVKVKPKQAEVRLKGPPESIRLLKPTHFNVFVNINTIYENIADLVPGRSYPGVSLEFQLTDKAPKGIILAEPLKSVTVDITE